MDESAFFNQLPDIVLAVPAWQMALYIVIISLFMLADRLKLCLIITYLFTLYWGFFLYWAEAMASVGRLPGLSLIYLIGGIMHITLTLIAFVRGEG